MVPASDPSVNPVEPNVLASTFDGIALVEFGPGRFKICETLDGIDADTEVVLRDWSELGEIFTKIARNLNDSPDLRAAADRRLPEELRNFLNWLPDWNSSAVPPAMAENRRRLTEQFPVQVDSSQKSAELPLGSCVIRISDQGVRISGPGKTNGNPTLAADDVITGVVKVLSDPRTRSAAPMNYGPFLGRFLEVSAVAAPIPIEAEIEEREPIAVGALPSHGEWVRAATEDLEAVLRAEGLYQEDPEHI